METEAEVRAQFKKSNIAKGKIVLVGFVILSALGYGSYYFYQKKVWFDMRSNESVQSAKDKKAYMTSFIGNDPKLLQELFVADMNNGVNDKFTKSDAYFLTHRYFDNGGDVYEIYDYINSHPDLAFLKEAEDIYPSIFDQIKNKSLPPIPYSIPSLYAILAYLEVLDKHGYADIAALGTLANQYAKTAYFIKERAKSGSDGTNISDSVSVIENNTKKAIFFELKAKESLIKIAQENNFSANDLLTPGFFKGRTSFNGILPHNLLVGLNQYAACLRYLEATGIDISIIDSPLRANDIFRFNARFSKARVPELEIFTSLLNASTLSLVSPQSVDALKVALQPILNFDTKKTKPFGILLGIIAAKDSKFTTGLDIYSKKNITTLGSIVPEFRSWLTSNGWKDTDFKLN